jgi:Na+-driven multidrug efflux pump
MIVLRRFLALIALFYWQGGFTFYASVVVPIGQQVFGPLRQGFLTRQVTVYLNLAGALALVVLVWDLLTARDPSKWRRRTRWLLWIGMMLTLLWLIRLHGLLDEHLVAKGYIIRDADAFRPGHRLYLWISTVQWAWGLLYVLATVAAWREEDRIGREAEQMQGAKKVPPLAPSASPSHRSSHTAEQGS